VALAADLLFAARSRAAAETAGVEIRMPRSAAAATAALEENPPDLVLVDLDLRWADATAFIANLETNDATAGAKVIAFVSHIREDAIDAARRAGADRVLARSAFVRQLPGLFAELKTGR